MSKKIFHRNDVRPALIGMGLAARRLMYICLASLPRKMNVETGSVEIDFDANQVFEIKVIEYARLCQIDYSVAYRQMVEGVKDLMGFVLTLDHTLTKQIDPALPKDWIAPFQIATDGTGYSKGEGFVRVKFHHKLAPLISDFTKGFTGQFLESAISISESNSGKIYLLLREWISSNKYKNEKIIQIDELRENLGISDFKTYKEFKKFKTDFFQRAIKKVIDKTEFSSIEMEIVERKARKAYKVKISWKLNEKILNEKEKEIDTFQKRFNESKVVLTGNKKEESRLFGTRYFNKAEAEKKGYKWD